MEVCHSQEDSTRASMGLPKSPLPQRVARGLLRVTDGQVPKQEWHRPESVDDRGTPCLLSLVLSFLQGTDDTDGSSGELNLSLSTQTLMQIKYGWDRASKQKQNKNPEPFCMIKQGETSHRE